MSEHIHNQLILVYDLTSNGIICQAASDAHASAIVLGMLNGKSMPFGKHYNPSLPAHRYNYNDIKLNYQVSKNFEIVDLPLKYVNKEWEDYRDLILKKAYYLGLWEFRVRQQLHRINDFYGLSSMMPFLTEQLSLCDPKNNYYTDPILEWADIQEVLPDVAYQELKMKQYGHGVVYLRSHALYSKYVRVLNTAENLDQLKEKFELAVVDLVRKAIV